LQIYISYLHGEWPESLFVRVSHPMGSSYESEQTESLNWEKVTLQMVKFSSS